MDAEYEQIRTIFNNRSKNSGQLPSRVIRFIPEERAKRVLAIDARISNLQKLMPVIVSVGIVLAFILGMAL